MCGIAGIYSKKRLPIPELEKRLSDMRGTLVHRGPDEEGMYVSPDLACGLAFRRLSIIDLISGSQPITNEDGTVFIVCNGEIYNYRQLRHSMENRGHVFHTNSDVEVINHLYEEYANEFASHLHGMFGLAVYDQNRHRLILSRDRFGEKPLYVYENGDLVVFASEMKAIIASGLFVRELNPVGESLYFSFGYIPAPYTIYRNVFKVLQSGSVEYGNGQVQKKQYWTISPTKKYSLSFRECMEETRELLTRAVSSQLMSDVPLGLYLSGGMDSSILLLLMHQITKEPVTTFTVKFPEKSYDESMLAQLLADRIPTHHHEISINYDEVLPNLIKVIGFFDEPYASATCIAKYFLSLLASQKVKVVLTGTGGDELFGGYGAYFASMFTASIPGFLKSRLYYLAEYFPDSLERTSITKRLRNFLIHESNPFPQSYYSWRMIFDREQRSVLDGITSFEVFEGLVPHCVPQPDWQDPLLMASFFDLLFYLEGEGLQETDRMAMANSLETRCPLLDVNLVEYAMNIPSRFKMRLGTGKHILREMFKHELPPEITKRGKYGFTLPIGFWLKNQLKHVFEQYAAQADWNDMKRKLVNRMWNEHLAGHTDHGHRLWSIITYEIWRMGSL